jgi:hypothetical protein
LICPYCGADASDPNEVASDGYMAVGHYIQECQRIPSMAREWYNKPWVRSNLRHRMFMRLHRRWPFSLAFTCGDEVGGGSP